jgi:type II restriction/modification system DNA methylase subunit YeeA
MPEVEAALYELPFAHIRNVRAHRAAMAQPAALETWWLHWRSRPELRKATRQLRRFIVTPRVSKYRLFVWTQSPSLADNAVVVIARDDDTSFGILQSHFHEVWSLRMGTWLGVGNDPRYTPTTCFETFPFPAGLTPNLPAAEYANDPRALTIAEAASELNRLRENWLNPPDLVERVPEVAPGYPDRIVPKDDKAATSLKKRTLTKLYNERPAWLDHAHHALDEAVAAAYGWPVDLSDDEILERLFRLNQERAAAQAEQANA